MDAGKTTLAESLLCACGVIEKAGRVDHGDAFLDNGDMERKEESTISPNRRESGGKMWISHC